MSDQLDSELGDIRRLLGIQTETMLTALDGALVRQPATSERKALVKRMAKAMSRHLYSWEEALKVDSLNDLVDALESPLE